jgi:hypothetical protein
MNILIVTPNYTDSISCSIVDGLVDLGHNVWVPGNKPMNYAYPYPENPIHLNFWIMADTDNVNGLQVDMYNPLNPSIKLPKVVVHGHDYFIDYTLAPLARVKPVPEIGVSDINFIRDLDKTLPFQAPTYPINYGVERRYLEACIGAKGGDFSTRPDDIVFWGTLDTAHRRKYLQAMQSAGINVKYGTYQFNTPDEKWSQWIYGRYTHDPDYYKALTQSKMVFCPIGAGWTCFRHMEAYASGAIPIIQRISSNIDVMHKFIDEENCLLWSDERELITKVRAYLSDIDKLVGLHLRCWEYAMNNLLTKHVAQSVLDRISEHCDV